ncbi:MAG TPA: ester cyclase [Thermoleophilaceae bacterium]|nr:ester cyclase [Thermoleophilaceae bacterium]
MSAAELDRARLEELAGRWVQAWSRGADFASCCTPDVSYEDPLTVDPVEGVEALEGHAARLRRALPDVRVERNAVALAGGPGEGFACLPWRLAGSHRGELAGLPATERFLVLHGLHYVELSDGFVRRARGFFDLHDVAVQLGFVPSRGSLAESTLLMLRGFGLRRRG